MQSAFQLAGILGVHKQRKQRKQRKQNICIIWIENFRVVYIISMRSQAEPVDVLVHQIACRTVLAPYVFQSKSISVEQITFAINRVM